MLQYQLWYGHGGYEEYLLLQQQVEQQREKSQQLTKHNQKLTGIVIDLKENTEAVEEYARLELGMIKRGEVFYQIIE